MLDNPQRVSRPSSWYVLTTCTFLSILISSKAGAIHTDFERGFIKAEVVAYDDFHSLCGGQKSMAPIKAAGKYRQEGRSYVSAN